ncbi:hypothetical protein PFBG_04188 [Plasmodium falciparum 7G8]|uniref:Uncharacterized protein n=1 Tax=Plasmodium falciparum (isolate 7G8) TaxID=57266 RepID=W7F492_PLAF8|nr:hypothetical protein PFBG_04188 [Plasmodium falciparum 7G8]
MSILFFFFFISHVYICKYTHIIWKIYNYIYVKGVKVKKKKKEKLIFFSFFFSQMIIQFYYMVCITHISHIYDFVNFVVLMLFID